MAEKITVEDPNTQKTYTFDSVEEYEKFIEAYRAQYPDDRNAVEINGQETTYEGAAGRLGSVFSQPTEQLIDVAGQLPANARPKLFNTKGFFLDNENKVEPARLLDSIKAAPGAVANYFMTEPTIGLYEPQNKDGTPDYTNPKYGQTFVTERPRLGYDDAAITAAATGLLAGRDYMDRIDAARGYDNAMARVLGREAVPGRVTQTLTPVGNYIGRKIPGVSDELGDIAASWRNYGRTVVPNVDEIAKSRVAAVGGLDAARRSEEAMEMALRGANQPPRAPNTRLDELRTGNRPPSRSTGLMPRGSQYIPQSTPQVRVMGDTGQQLRALSSPRIPLGGPGVANINKPAARAILEGMTGGVPMAEKVADEIADPRISGVEPSPTIRSGDALISSSDVEAIRRDPRYFDVRNQEELLERYGDDQGQRRGVMRNLKEGALQGARRVTGAIESLPKGVKVGAAIAELPFNAYAGRRLRDQYAIKAFDDVAKAQQQLDDLNNYVRDKSDDASLLERDRAERLLKYAQYNRDKQMYDQDYNFSQGFLGTLMSPVPYVGKPLHPQDAFAKSDHGYLANVIGGGLGATALSLSGDHGGWGGGSDFDPEKEKADFQRYYTGAPVEDGKATDELNNIFEELYLYTKEGTPQKRAEAMMRAESYVNQMGGNVARQLIRDFITNKEVQTNDPEFYRQEGPMDGTQNIEKLWKKFVREKEMSRQARTARVAGDQNAVSEGKTAKGKKQAVSRGK